MKFRKKPVEIEAEQFNPEQKERFSDFIMEALCNRSHTAKVWGDVHIHTLEGNMIVRPGDWIIKGIKGEFYPCKPDIFEATYEKID